MYMCMYMCMYCSDVTYAASLTPMAMRMLDLE